MASMKICVPAAVLVASACQAPLDTTRTVDPYASFGEVIYREACQRVAYTGQLAQQQAGTIDRVDVSGSLGRAVCVAGEPPPVDAPPKLFAIAAERPELIQTVDAILPQPFLATLETFLERILPLYDDGTVPRAITTLGDLLGKMHDDPGVPPALARLGARHGYRPPEIAPGLVHALVEYPDIDGFIGSFLGLVGPGGAAEPEWHALLAAGAVTLGTAEPAANPAAPDRSLKLALDLMLSRHPDLVAGTERPLVARDARGLALAATEGGAVIAPFVDLDRDGLADVDADGRFVDAQGAALVVPTPFPEPGVTDTAPRDALGRALTAPGAATTLYQYLDLDGTLLAGAAREAPALLDANKDTVLGLVWGAVGLLGPRAMQTRTYRDAAGAVAGAVTYNGFDTTQAAALDLLHAFVQVLGAPNADQILQSAATLLAQHESPASRVIGAMLDASDRGKQHPLAQVPGTSTIYDELAPLLARALRVPGLAQDLVVALENPHVRGLAPMMARLMTATNQIDFNHTNAPFGTARGAPDYDLVASLSSIALVDRTRPDTDYNRSLMQRIAHMVHDSNGARFCNKDGAIALSRTFAKCRLFEIDDLSLLYALNLASDAVRMDATRRATTYSKASFREQVTDPGLKGLISDDTLGDTVLQGMVGITGFTRFPSPKALARALFLRASDSGTSQFLKDTTDPTTCTDGDQFIDVHDKSIFAWELPLGGNPSGFPGDTFFDAVRPLIDAFAKHDECVAFDASNVCTSSQNAVKIFVDLLSMLHEHWGSPQSSYFGHVYQAADRAQPRFAFPDNVVSYEPLLAEVLRGDLVPATLAFAPVLDTFTSDGTPAGPRALPVLIDAMRYVFDPQVTPAGLAYRSGATSAVMSDGTTPVARATPFYLLGDAFAHKRAALAALSATPDGAVQAGKWEAATSALVDQVLTVDQAGGVWQFRNRRFHAMTQLLIDFVRGRLQAHAGAGDLDAWVHRELTADLTDKLGGPVFAALGDLVARLEHDSAARAQLYGLLSYLVDEPGHDRVFQTALTTLADQAQLFLDDRDLVPIARVLGAAMDPATGLVDAQIALVKRSYDLDTDNALVTILRNLFRPDATGVHPAADLADLVAELNRSVPGHGGDLDAGDEASLLGELRAFFLDSQRGFVRFVSIVQHRSPQQSSR
jgi:hypothetical protein